MSTFIQSTLQSSTSVFEFCTVYIYSSSASDLRLERWDSRTNGWRRSVEKRTTVVSGYQRTERRWVLSTNQVHLQTPHMRTRRNKYRWWIKLWWKSLFQGIHELHSLVPGVRIRRSRAASSELSHILFCFVSTMCPFLPLSPRSIFLRKSKWSYLERESRLPHVCIRSMPCNIIPVCLSGCADNITDH